MGTQYNSIDCHYAECRDFFAMLDVVMLSVAVLNAIMLSVVAQTK